MDRNKTIGPPAGQINQYGDGRAGVHLPSAVQSLTSDMRGGCGADL